MNRKQLKSNKKGKRFLNHGLIDVILFSKWFTKWLALNILLNTRESRWENKCFGMQREQDKQTNTVERGMMTQIILPSFQKGEKRFVQS